MDYFTVPIFYLQYSILTLNGRYAQNMSLRFLLGQRCGDDPNKDDDLNIKIEHIPNSKIDDFIQFTYSKPKKSFVIIQVVVKKKTRFC